VTGSPSLPALSALLAEQARHWQRQWRPLAPPSYLDLSACPGREILAGQVLRCACSSAGMPANLAGDRGPARVTRQAAFQRFGKPIDPRTGELMDKTVHMTDAAERAVQIVTDVLDNRWTRPGRPLTPRCWRRSPTKCEVRHWPRSPAWSACSLGLRLGRAVRRRIGDHTVVDIPLRYEAGDMKARVAFDTDERSPDSSSRARGREGAHDAR